MLIVDGIFENGVFIPNKPLSNLSGRQNATLTIDDNPDNKNVNHSAYGRLKAYANPSLMSEEKGAWEKAVMEKYAIH